MKKIEVLKKIFLFLLKAVLCLVGMSYVLGQAFYVHIWSKTPVSDWDFQIYLYYILAGILVITLSLLPFLKVKKWIFVLVLLLAFSYQYYSKISPSIDNEYAKINYELEGVCKEGMVIKYNNQEIIINKESCLKNGWTWYEKEKYCSTY